MIGIVCTDDISIVGHNLFSNFRKAIISIFSNIKDIRCSNDLADIETLIIIDEHFHHNVEIWKREEFLNVLNENNIKTLIINFESIFNSPFSLAIDHQNFIQRINRKYQLVADVRDAKILGNNIVTKQHLSKNTDIFQVSAKKNAGIFLGQINDYYPTRHSIVEEFKSINIIEPCVHVTDRKLTYTEFLSTLGSYKYVFNPLGIGQFINLRFYEALNLGCIVLQQYTNEMDNFYKELNHPSVIKFRTIEELVKKLEDQTVEYTPYTETLEDYFNEINLKEIISNL
jgi:hypothetical protein